MSDKPFVSIFIDGNELRVPQGTTIIEAAKSIGIEIPHYCYHPHLSTAGNCRMCLTEMGLEVKDKATGQTILDENGKPKIQWLPRPQIACATTAASGQHFRTTSAIVKDARSAVMEFLLINHPLDCPICDQAGECHLQEYAADYGRGTSRFSEDKNRKPKHTPLGPRVILDDERCVLCGRCVRFCREIIKDDVLGFVDRGSHTTLTCYPGRQLENNYSLNTVDLCPVGALTSADFRFKMRVWFLKETPSICEESSAGVNTTVWSREGKLYRITPRQNNEVNDSWMSDSGRELYKLNSSAGRLLVDKNTPHAFDEIVRALQKSRHLAIVASGRMSVEEQFLLKRLAALIEKPRVEALSHIKEGDGMLISADRVPNTRGLFLTGLKKEYPQATLAGIGGLKEALAAGKIDTLLVVREDILAAGITPEDLKNVTLIVLETHQSATTQIAQIVHGVATVFERSGSFINQQWRIQKFSQAIPPQNGLCTDIVFWDKVLQKLGEQPLSEPTPEAVWRLMAETIPQFKKLSYEALPATGAVLDSQEFEGVEFPEKKGMHYE